MMQKLNPHKFLFKILHCIPSALWNVVSFVSHFKELSINSWSLFSSVQRKEPVCFCFGSGYFAFPHAWFLWFALSSWCHLFCMPGSTGHLTRSGYGCITLLLLHRLHSHLTSPSACVHPAAAELCGTIPGCRPDSYPMLGADFNPGWWQLWAPSAGACGSNQLSASVESSLGLSSDVSKFCNNSQSVKERDGTTCLLWKGCRVLVGKTLRRRRVALRAAPGRGGVPPCRMPSLSARWVCKCQQVAVSCVRLREMWQGWAVNAVQEMSRRPSYLNRGPRLNLPLTLSTAGAPHTVLSLFLSIFFLSPPEMKINFGTECNGTSFWNIRIVLPRWPCWLEAFRPRITTISSIVLGNWKELRIAFVFTTSFARRVGVTCDLELKGNKGKQVTNTSGWMIEGKEPGQNRWERITFCLKSNAVTVVVCHKIFQLLCGLPWNINTNEFRSRFLDTKCLRLNLT